MSDELKVQVIKAILKDAFGSFWEGEKAWKIIGCIINDIVNMDENDERSAETLYEEVIN